MAKEGHPHIPDLEQIKKRLQAGKKSLLEIERKAEDLDASVHAAKEIQELLKRRKSIRPQK